MAKVIKENDPTHTYILCNVLQCIFFFSCGGVQNLQNTALIESQSIIWKTIQYLARNHHHLHPSPPQHHHHLPPPQQHHHHQSEQTPHPHLSFLH